MSPRENHAGHTPPAPAEGARAWFGPQDQPGLLFHAKCLVHLLSPVLYSPQNEEQIGIDFGTTGAVNYWS